MMLSGAVGVFAIQYITALSLGGSNYGLDVSRNCRVVSRSWIQTEALRGDLVPKESHVRTPDFTTAGML